MATWTNGVFKATPTGTVRVLREESSQKAWECWEVRDRLRVGLWAVMAGQL